MVASFTTPQIVAWARVGYRQPSWKFTKPGTTTRLESRDLGPTFFGGEVTVELFAGDTLGDIGSAAVHGRPILTPSPFQTHPRLIT